MFSAGTYIHNITEGLQIDFTLLLHGINGSLVVELGHHPLPYATWNLLSGFSKDLDKIPILMLSQGQRLWYRNGRHLYFWISANPTASKTPPSEMGKHPSNLSYSFPQFRLICNHCMGNKHN